MGGDSSGGPEEIRTPDPYNANVMRSQLRYRPKYLRQNVAASCIIGGVSFPVKEFSGG